MIPMTQHHVSSIDAKEERSRPAPRRFQKPKTTDKDESVELMTAALDRGDHDAVKKLLLSNRLSAAHRDPKTWDAWLVKALPQRSSNDNCNCLRVLLEHGGNPNARDASGRSLLQLLAYRRDSSCCHDYIALQEAQYLRALKLLLRHGANPNEQLCAGEDPMWMYETEKKHHSKNYPTEPAVLVCFSRRFSDAAHQVIKAFLSAPTFDLTPVSEELLPAVIQMGDVELLKMLLQVADRSGIPVDVNERYDQVPLCLLDRSGKTLPSLLQRGLSLDGSFKFVERNRSEFYDEYFHASDDSDSPFGTPAVTISHYCRSNDEEGSMKS